MNADPRPLRVFISGNSSEFGLLRKVASEAVLQRGWVPVAQDHFTTEHGSLPEVLRRLVESCDATICLIGGQYGHEPRTHQDRRRSYTQMEYDFARACGQPVYLLFSRVPAKPDEPEKQDSGQAALQQAFIHEIKATDQLWHPFATAEELKLRILAIAPPSPSRPAAPPKSRALLVGALSLAVVVPGLFLLPPFPVQKSAASPAEKAAPPSAPPPLPVEPKPKSKLFKNSLGMEFTPVAMAQADHTLLFSRWETRIHDWKIYTEETGKNFTPPAGAHELHPVTGIAVLNMADFCEWLTSRETARGTLPQGARYRLPADAEWFAAAGTKPGNPATVYSSRKAGEPPSEAMANYAGSESAIGNPALPNDRFVKTAPVGSYPANAAGLFDMAGNVAEVCTVPQRQPIIVGGDWQDADLERLNMSAQRTYDAADDICETVGFRCVLDIPPGVSW